MENDIVRMLFLRRQRQKKRWKIKTISGAPPLSFKAKAGALRDYRIYGQTSRNLFDLKAWANTITSVRGNGIMSISGNTVSITSVNIQDCYTLPYTNSAEGVYQIPVKPNTKYIIQYSKSSYASVIIFENGTTSFMHTSTGSITTHSDTTFLTLRMGVSASASLGTTVTISNCMISEGSTALPYEPYGESVGDRTGNLFEAELVNYNVSANGQISALTDFILSIAPVIAGTTYTISNNQTTNVYAFYQQYPKPERYSYNSSRYVFNENSITIVAPIDGYIVVRKAASGPPIMLNTGSTPLPYEPYGYKVPVTVSNGTDSQIVPIYLPEQIKKVGDEPEYVSYDDQKLHRVGADDIDVTLPTISMLAGTNVMTVGTAVQPSDVYIKGRIKKGE